MCKMGFGVGLRSRAGSSWRPVLGSGFDFFFPPKFRTTIDPRQTRTQTGQKVRTKTTQVGTQIFENCTMSDVYLILVTMHGYVDQYTG